MKFLFNPNRFNHLSELIIKPLFYISLISLLFGLLFALLLSPNDYQQGSSVRIMYVHVPSAWLALLTFVIMTIYSIIGLAFKTPFCFIVNSAIAPIGATFTIICLITGSLWGKPMWGTWWVWDARLTSMLILFIFFMGYIALSNAFEKNERGSRPAALLAIAGSINLPIVKFSVDWWNTLHQPASIIRTGGISIDDSMLVPLIIMALAFKSFFILVVILRSHSILIERKIFHLKIQGKL